MVILFGLWTEVFSDLRLVSGAYWVFGAERSGSGSFHGLPRRQVSSFLIGNMNASLVMTVVGPDRPGLVDSLAKVISSQGGNWLESRMCNLEGQFAGILSVDVPSENRESLLALLKNQSPGGLEIVVHDRIAGSVSACSSVAEIALVGQDRPGIVSQISAAFAKYEINVEELNTEVRSAPMSGEQLFEAQARVCIPADCDMDALRDELERIAADLLVDVSFEVS